MKIFIAIPSYDHKVYAQTMAALLQEQMAADTTGDQLIYCVAPGYSLVTHARNDLVKNFLDSDCQRLFFIDADVAWEQGALLKLAKMPVDIVGGAYRYKHEPESYPIHWPPVDVVKANADGLIEVHGLPTGFMSVSRSVFARLKARFHERAYEFHGKAYHAFFHAPFMDGKFHGEDTAFCAEWRSIGGKLYLDPTLKLTHVEGGQSYTGCIADWLKRKAK